MPHDPQATLLDMIQAVRRALALSGGMDGAQFLNDERVQWAVFSQFVILGEAASRLPAEFCEKHPEVPWSAAVGMRHRLVHGYDRVDWTRVWRTVNFDLPPLLKQLEEIVSGSNLEGT